MSLSAVNYVLNENYLTGSAKVYYSFDSSSSAAATGCIFNSLNSGTNTGFVLKATGTIGNKIGTLSQVMGGGGANLSKSNILIAPPYTFPTDDVSILFLFQKPTGAGVLFGSLEKYSTTINGQVYESSAGFDFGVTDRQQLFLHWYSPEGDVVEVAHNIELAKSNIVSVSFGNGMAEIALMDYLTDTIYDYTAPIGTSYQLNPNSIYLGGSKHFFESSGDPSGITFSGRILEMLIISGRTPKETLFKVGSGLIGTYYTQSGTVSYTPIVTGYTSTPMYGTGITGYQLVQTGSIYVPNDVIRNVSSVSSGASYFVKEGERFFEYDSITGTGWTGAYKREVGYLDSSLFGTYSPTGDAAHATLGLQDVSGSKKPITITNSPQVDYAQVPLYRIDPMTGITTNITGYTSTALTGTVITTGAASSGVTLTGSASEYKLDTLYYLWKR